MLESQHPCNLSNTSSVRVPTPLEIADAEEVAQQMNTSKTGDAAREKTAILEPDAKRLKKIGIHE